MLDGIFAMYLLRARLSAYRLEEERDFYTGPVDLPEATRRISPPPVEEDLPTTSLAEPSTPIPSPA